MDTSFLADLGIGLALVQVTRTGWERRTLLIFVAICFGFEEINIGPKSCFSSFVTVTREKTATVDYFTGIQVDCSSVRAYVSGTGCQCNYGGTFYHDTGGQLKCYSDYGQKAGCNLHLLRNYVMSVDLDGNPNQLVGQLRFSGGILRPQTGCTYAINSIDVWDIRSRVGRWVRFGRTDFELVMSSRRINFKWTPNSPELLKSVYQGFLLKLRMVSRCGTSEETDCLLLRIKGSRTYPLELPASTSSVSSLIHSSTHTTSSVSSLIHSSTHATSSLPTSNTKVIASTTVLSPLLSSKITKYIMHTPALTTEVIAESTTASSILLLSSFSKEEKSTNVPFQVQTTSILAESLSLSLHLKATSNLLFISTPRATSNVLGTIKSTPLASQSIFSRAIPTASVILSVQPSIPASSQSVKESVETSNVRRKLSIDSTPAMITSLSSNTIPSNAQLDYTIHGTVKPTSAGISSSITRSPSPKAPGGGGRQKQSTPDITIIAGAVAGGVVGVSIAVFVIICVRRGKRSRPRGSVGRKNAGKDKLSVNSLSRILPDRATNAVNKKIIPVKEIDNPIYNDSILTLDNLAERSVAPNGPSHNPQYENYDYVDSQVTSPNRKSHCLPLGCGPATDYETFCYQTEGRSCPFYQVVDNSSKSNTDGTQPQSPTHYNGQPQSPIYYDAQPQSPIYHVVDDLQPGSSQGLNQYDKGTQNVRPDSPIYEQLEQEKHKCLPLTETDRNSPRLFTNFSMQGRYKANGPTSTAENRTPPYSQSEKGVYQEEKRESSANKTSDPQDPVYHVLDEVTDNGKPMKPARKVKSPSENSELLQRSDQMRESDMEAKQPTSHEEAFYHIVDDMIDEDVQSSVKVACQEHLSKKQDERLSEPKEPVYAMLDEADGSDLIYSEFDHEDSLKHRSGLVNANYLSDEEYEI